MWGKERIFSYDKVQVHSWNIQEKKKQGVSSGKLETTDY